MHIPRTDLVMVGAGADPMHFAALRELKQEGRVRYIGVHHLATPPYSRRRVRQDRVG